MQTTSPAVRYEWFGGDAELSTDDIDRINQLLQELSEGSSDRPKDPVTAERINRIVRAPDFHLLLAREAVEGGAILGMATVCVIDHLDGCDAMVHDVVVSRPFRSCGIGEQLVDRVIERARELGIRYLELTCAPFRERGNRLYEKKGFHVRPTNIRRLHLMGAVADRE